MAPLLGRHEHIDTYHCRRYKTDDTRLGQCSGMTPEELRSVVTIVA
jgi:hypothetical protein